MKTFNLLGQFSEKSSYTAPLKCKLLSILSIYSTKYKIKANFDSFLIFSLAS